MTLVKSATIEDDIPDLIGVSGSYSEDLLSSTERMDLSDRLSEIGFMKFNEILRIVLNETQPTSDLDHLHMDADLIHQIDIHIREKMFIVNDGVYTRSKLYEKFPMLNALGVLPEAICRQQLIAVFDSDKVAVDACTYDGETNEMTPHPDAILCKPSEILRKVKSKPSKIVRTKIYVAKEEWNEHRDAYAIFSNVAKVAKSQHITEKLLLTYPEDERRRLRLTLTGSESQNIHTRLIGRLAGMFNECKKDMELENTTAVLSITK